MYHCLAYFLPITFDRIKIFKCHLFLYGITHHLKHKMTILVQNSKILKILRVVITPLCESPDVGLSLLLSANLCLQRMVDQVNVCPMMQGSGVIQIN